MRFLLRFITNVAALMPGGGIPAGAILNEDGSPILNEDGSFILNE